MQKYRLGIDLGATSLGWAIYNTENNQIIDLGVRIFDDGRDDNSKASLCVARRQARNLRRLFKRHVTKMIHLTKALTDIKLLPESESERQKLKDLNPYRDMQENANLSKDKLRILKKMPLYALRAKALDEKLELYEIGRILIHLGQRKGFLSNRKSSGDIGGILNKGNKCLKENMNKCFDGKARTYGEYLYLKHLEDPGAPIRLKKALKKNGGKTQLADGIEFPYRSEYKNEFNAVWEKQREFYPELLNDENKEKIANILFFQRPLKDPEVGFCRFERGEKRVAKAHPLFQEFRIRQEINNIKISDLVGNYVPLDSSEREMLFDALCKNPKNKSMKLSDVRKCLKLGADISINYEGSDKDKSGDNKTFLTNSTELAIKKSDSDELKAFWNNLENKGDLINFLDRSGNIIKDARTVEDQEKKIIEYLCKGYNLSEEAAQILLNIPLEDGYGSLSEKAINNILVGLREGLLYNEACEKAGYNHSEYQYQKLNVLPYYGKILRESCLGAKTNPQNDEERFGKIGNATVHVALNQVRLLVNELIKTYGKPNDISIEYARELSASAKERLAIQNRQNKNRDDNDRIRKDIKDKCGRDINPSKEDIKKYKIWESMSTNPKNRVCPYTGKIISICQLFSPEISPETEIDHILPFSRTFDDSMNNKVVCFREANRDKGNRTPYEAFGSEENSEYSWEDILQNIKNLNEERRWRFSKDAMKKFDDKDSPIARSLNDTRYMTRVLQQYLLPIVDEGGYKTVQSVRGGLTSMIREVWGLNLYKEKDNPEKYRTEHYHHAVDAIVIAAINRGQIESISRELKRQRANIRESIEQEFKGEIWKLKKENENKVSEWERADLRKRIQKCYRNRCNELVAKCVKKPENLETNKVKDLVSKINISHKPSLKDIQNLNSTVGQLHKETAYGLSSISEDGSKWIFHIKKKKDPKPKGIAEYIPIFRNKKDRDEYFDAYKKWFIVEGSSSQVNGKPYKQIKEELTQDEKESRKALCEAAKKAFKWHVGGNNFCLVVYKINDNHKIKGVPAKNRGKFEFEVVSNYNATIRSRRGEDISYLSYKYPTSRKIMTLRCNDMVKITFLLEEIEGLPADDRVIENGKIKKVKTIENGKEEECELKGSIVNGFGPGLRAYLKEKIAKSNEQDITVLFCVRKMDLQNRIYFTPHDVARELSKDDMSLCISSASGFEKYQIRKVHITPTGRIKYA